MKTTERLAIYALETSYRSFSKEVVHQGKRCFLDLIGVALGGANQPLGKILVRIVKIVEMRLVYLMKTVV